MNKQLRTILVLLSGLTLVFAAGCQKKTVTATTEPVIPVKVQAVTTGKVTEAVDYAVIVEPLAQASISPKISGRVQSIPVGLGTYVHKGETLIQLDPTDYQIQLQQAKANLAKAQADFETSEGNGPARAQVIDQNSSRVRIVATNGRGSSSIGWWPASASSTNGPRSCRSERI